MADNFISNVLNILRLLKNSDLQGASPIIYIENWAGAGMTEMGQAASLRVCAYVQDQCDGAATLLSQSGLAEEARAGLHQTVNSLKTAFSVQNLHTAVASHLPQLDTSISSFAMLEGARNLGGKRADEPELGKLISEIMQMISLFGVSEIDLIVRQTAHKHLHVLLALLNNLEAFGVDAAMAAYAELVIRLRRVDSTASQPTKEKTSKAWPIIEKWLGRLATIDKAYNNGQNLIEGAQGLGQLLLGAE